jgi:hypothetical protein
MRRLALMKSISMTNATRMTRAGFSSPFPQAADRSLIVGVRGVFYASSHNALAVKDVAYFRSGRPPV